MEFYDFKVKDSEENEVSLSDYEGKVILVVNSATKCGFTPQYDGLQSMYEIYGPKGFVILDFPCNQFAAQAPGTISDIISFCDSTYGITFPIFDKIEVNGPNEHPLYTFLKSQKGFQGFDENYEYIDMYKKGVHLVDPDADNNDNIKWNFTKFLINRKGKVVERFEPTVDLMEIERKLDMML